jgi:hypothetical protein
MKKANLNPVAAKLIDRIITDFANYCGTPTEHQLLAMACNPLSATVGFKLISDYQKALINKGKLSARLHEDFKKEAYAILEKTIREKCSNMLNDKKVPESAMDVSAVTLTPEEPEKEDEEENFLIEVRRTKVVQSKDSTVDEVEAELLCYAEYTHDWSKNMASEGVDPKIVKQIGTNIDSWAENWQLISDNFDIMKWWENQKTRFPLIYLVACHILAAPDSNGHQERTFSAATWMDGKLSNRQTDATFQRKVLLYKNADYIKESRISISENFKKKAREASLKAINESIAARKRDKIKEKERREKEQSEKDWDENSTVYGEGDYSGDEKSVEAETIEDNDSMENDDEQVLREILMPELQE